MRVLKYIRVIFIIFTLHLFSFATAQTKVYTVANAHSHNDYEQVTPFYLAFNRFFGSIEADIHLKNGSILVGHDTKDLLPEKTFEKLYLKPLNQTITSKRKLQLLIDIKTDAKPTLDTLISLLKKYPKIIHSSAIKIIISGNRPDPKEYLKYPNFIWFDGRLEEEYTSQELRKIGLLSQDFSIFTNGNYNLPLNDIYRNRISSAINKAHALKKSTRLWGNPDYKEGWQEIINLGIDYINTDHIDQLANFLNQ